MASRFSFALGFVAEESSLPVNLRLKADETARLQLQSS